MSEAKPLDGGMHVVRVVAGRGGRGLEKMKGMGAGKWILHWTMHHFAIAFCPIPPENLRNPGKISLDNPLRKGVCENYPQNRGT